MWSAIYLPAVDGEDYIISDFNISFPVGSTGGKQSCLMIHLLDDDNVEGDHYFTVGFNASTVTPGSSSVLIGSPDAIRVNIEDDDG